MIKFYNKKVEAKYHASIKRQAEQATAKATATALLKPVAVATAPAINATVTTVTTASPQAESVKEVKFVEQKLAPMTRADFTAMSDKARSEFSRNGGRLLN